MSVPQAGQEADREAVLTARLRAAGCVWAEDEAVLLVEAAGGDPAQLEELVARRVAGTPLEVVLGWADLGDVRLALGPGVFVPRARSGVLVDAALAHLRARPGPGRGADPGAVPAVVVDLCCGTAALGCAVAHRAAAAGLAVALTAADVDPVATRWAAVNVARWAPGGRVLTGDLDAPLPRALRGRVDVLLVNAPYVPSAAVATMPPEAREHEPRPTLDGGTDGLDLHRRVAALAPRWLAPGGALVLETSTAQAGRTLDLVAAAGLDAEVRRDDDRDGTCVVGTRPA